MVIANGAFKDNKALTKVVVPQGVVFIGDDAFSGCESLNEINIPEKAEIIGAHAFGGCTALDGLYLANPDIKVGEDAFVGCGIKSLSANYSALGGLAGVQVSSLTVTGGSVPDAGLVGLNSLESLTVADGVTLAPQALDGCDSLVSLSLPCLGTYDGADDTLANLFGGTVPQTLKNVTVRGGEIDFEAFKDCTGLEKVFLDGVTAVYNSAFDGCAGLLTVGIGKSVECMGNFVFSGCPKVNIFCEAPTKPIDWDDEWNADNRPVKWGANLTDPPILDFEIEDNILNKYKGTGGDVIIPSGIISIGKEAFKDCASLTSVKIPNSVEQIDDRAFWGCENLTNILIPKSVKSISACVFSSCKNVTSITVESGNSVYHSDGNCLIKTKSKTLVTGCKKSIIPSDGSVTEIGDYSFLGCVNLTRIVLPNGVTKIGNWAFNVCVGLKHVIIPGTVNEIMRFAFYYCSSLSIIEYNGTKEQWKRITKGEGWNDYTGEYTVQCADVDLSKDEITILTLAPIPPTVEGVIAEIERIYQYGATRDRMREVASKLQNERAKPENKTPEIQKQLNEALQKLLKAMMMATK